MKKKLPLILILIPIISWCQIQITGKVIDEESEFPLVGVNIVEKGTKNGTSTDFDGNFSFAISDKNSILIVSYLGYVTQEIKLKGKTKIKIELEVACTRDWFDKQHIGFYLKSGVINNPIGGQFNFSLPAIFGEPTLETVIGYQTNLEENHIFNAQIGVYHLFANCDFSADVIASYQNLNYEEKIKTSSYAIETNLNFNEITVISGLSKIDFNNSNKIGPMLGLGTWLSKPFMMTVSAKTTIYKNLNEYQVKINKRYKGFYGFLKYYRIDEFNELSIGFGIEIVYLTKSQRR